MALHTGADSYPRFEEAIDHLRSRCLEDGWWVLDWTLPGRAWFQVNHGPGKPSPGVTRREMGILINLSVG
jgi:hypothetical protein